MLQSTDAQIMEKEITNAIAPLVRELRLLNIADLIALIHSEKHHMVADIVESACEQFFAAGFVVYAEKGKVDIDWDTKPTIQLAMAMHVPTLCFEFDMVMDGRAVRINLTDVKRDADGPTDHETVNILRRSISVNVI